MEELLYLPLVVSYDLLCVLHQMQILINYNVSFFSNILTLLQNHVTFLNWASLLQDIVAHLADSITRYDWGSCGDEDKDKKGKSNKPAEKNIQENKDLEKGEVPNEEVVSNQEEDIQEKETSELDLNKITLNTSKEDAILFYNYVLTHVKEGDLNTVKEDVSVIINEVPEEFKAGYSRALLTAVMWTLFSLSAGITVYLLLDLYCDMSIGVSFWDYWSNSKPKPPLDPVAILIQHGLNPTEILLNKRNPIFSDVYDTVDYVTQDQPLIIFPYEMPNDILLNCGQPHDLLEGIDYNPRTWLSDVYIDSDNQNNFHMFDPLWEDNFTKIDESIPIHGDISNQPGLYSNCGYVPYDPTLRYDEVLAHNDFEISVPDFEKK